MAQAVAVVRGTLPNTLGGTVDLTKAGFGSVTAAILITCQGRTNNTPVSSGMFNLGFWDGTNQRAVAAASTNGQATVSNSKQSNDAYGVTALNSSTSFPNNYSVTSITDGIRLTMDVDNTSASRLITVILLNGISAVVGTLTPNSSQNGTQDSASLGFAPKLVFFLSVGETTADVLGNGSHIAFGFAEAGGTHRSTIWEAIDGVADEALTIKHCEDRCVGQVASGAMVWSGEVTTWGADTFTLTTRDGGTGTDVCFFLALGGADLSFDVGTLTTPTSTGNDVNATDVDPDGLLLMLSNATSTTIATNSECNGLMAGVADANGQFCHNMYIEDGAATSLNGCVASNTVCLDLDSASGGARTDVCAAAVTLNTTDFTLNYTTVDATARKGWWVAFGAAAGGANPKGPFSNPFCGPFGGPL